MANSAPGGTTIDVYPTTGPNPLYVGVQGIRNAIADIAHNGTINVHIGAYNTVAPIAMSDISKSFTIQGVGGTPVIQGSVNGSIINITGLVAPHTIILSNLAVNNSRLLGRGVSVQNIAYNGTSLPSVVFDQCDVRGTGANGVLVGASTGGPHVVNITVRNNSYFEGTYGLAINTVNQRQDSNTDQLACGPYAKPYPKVVVQDSTLRGTNNSGFLLANSNMDAEVRRNTFFGKLETLRIATKATAPFYPIGGCAHVEDNDFYATDLALDLGTNTYQSQGITLLTSDNARLGHTEEFSATFKKSRIHLQIPATTDPEPNVDGITCGTTTAGDVINRTGYKAFPNSNIVFDDVTIDAVNPVRGLLKVLAVGCSFTNVRLSGSVSARWGIRIADDRPYCNNTSSNNIFSGIDFSNLTVKDAEIVLGRYTHDNYFGSDKENGLSGNVWGPLDAGALGVVLNDGSSNQFVRNDYALTGAPGWAFDASGSLIRPGCVLLDVDAENNFVFESGGFRVGNAMTQVYDASLLHGTTNNKVVGHAANTYQSGIYENPGIGQRLQAIRRELDAREAESASLFETEDSDDSTQ